MFATVAELAEKLAVPIPNEHTDRLVAKAREHDIYVQSGTMIEADPRWPGVLFNTTCLIGPGGVLAKYRKVNPWIPFEVHASPHDVPATTRRCFRRRHADRSLGCRLLDAVQEARASSRNGSEVLITRGGLHGPGVRTEPGRWT